MRQRPRTIMKILIEKGSPLCEGRLPVNHHMTPDGIIARVDPVSYAALLASAGKYFPLDEVVAYMIEMSKGYSANDNKQPANASGEQDDQ